MRGLLALGMLVCLTAPAAAQVELRNDGFEAGQAAAFQAGFCPSEAGASRFVANAAGRQILRVRFLFGGGDPDTRTVTVKVWDDTGGGNAPEGELYAADFEVTGSNAAFTEVDLSSANVIVPQQFRVGIVFHESGAPAIAADTDGINASRNYLFAALGQGVPVCDATASLWERSSTFGLTGDWVIRAFVSDDGSTPTPDANMGGGPDGGGTGEACSGNPDCPVGQYCNTSEGTCTFDCRSSDDCGGDTCNSLGQCVEGGGGGGCGCRADGGAEASLLLALGVLGLVVRRRR